MQITRAGESTIPGPIRLWPGLGAAALLLVAKFGVPIVRPDDVPLAMISAVVLALLIFVWWVFFSRASRTERWGGAVLMIIAMLATASLLHASIATAGMGMLFPILAIPVLSLALVAWAVASRYIAPRARLATLAATIIVACGGWTLLRTGGISNGGDLDLAWRWSPTPEERLLALATDQLTTRPTPSAKTGTEPEWPGFRGPRRDSIIRGVRIETDWTAFPPVELWRRPVGPAWSSFAVSGNLIYTQEQRGESEVVSSYTLDTGEPVWKHSDATRFWEANAGAGPRGTPTLSDGRVYTFGGTGVLNALDARDGTQIWSCDVASEMSADIPYWGFASSPLVVDDAVIIGVAGQLVGYDVREGHQLWTGPDGGGGYSSPHLFTIDGVKQVVLMTVAGATSVSPVDGSVLWEHAWPGGTRIVQPALTTSGDLLISRGVTTGIRRISVGHETGGWTTREHWTSVRLKPYFSDFVVHQGHAYGFDGNILASMDVEKGNRNWKRGRYGSGQLFLLADQDLLVILSEEGELALVGADPEQFVELGRFRAVEGKTWNHPVLIGDILLVRNSEEMTAFRLSLTGRASSAPATE